MLITASNLQGYSIRGIDDYIGTISDLYFDNWHWTIRYLVVEIAESQETVKYLISPFSAGNINKNSKEISVALTLSKVQNSPQLSTNLPISRQYELALRRYYEWPDYWEQTSFTDPPPPQGIIQKDQPTLDEVGKEILQPSIDSDNDETLSDTSENELPDEPVDQEIIEAEFGLPEEELQFSIELRSYQELKGYRIQTTDNDTCAVENLIIDDSDWSTKYLVINLHNSHENELILLTTNFTQQIDWGSKLVFSSLSLSQLQNAPRFQYDMPITIDFEKKVFNYFDSL